MKPRILLLSFIFFYYSEGRAQSENITTAKLGIDVPGKLPRVCLVVNAITSKTHSEKTKMVTGSFVNIGKLTYSNPKYSWISITEKSTQCDSRLTFFTTTDVLEAEESVEFKVRLSNTDSVYNRSFRVSTDSLASGIERICHSIAGIISGQLNPPGDKVGLYYSNTIADGKLLDYTDLIDNTFLYLLEAHGSLRLIREKSRTFDLRFESTVTKVPGPDEDGYNLSIRLFESGGKEVYQVKKPVQYFSILRDLKDAFTGVETFLENYHKIKREVDKFNTADQLINYVSKLQDHDIERSITLVNRALQLSPQYTPALIKLGELYWTNYEYASSEKYLKQALDLDPNNPRIHFLLGRTYYDLYYDSLAAIYLSKAQASPNKDSQLTIEVLRMLANIEIGKQRFDDAIAKLHEAFALNQKDSATWRSLGNAYYRKYSSQKRVPSDSADIYTSVKYFVEGSKLFKDSTFSRNASYLLNFWGECIYLSIRTEEQRDRDIMSRADLARKKFLIALSFKHYDKNVMAFSYNYLAYLSRFYYFNEPEALTYSEKAFNLKPTDEWSYRLYAFLRKHDPKSYQNAKLAIEKAMLIDSKNTESYSILAELHRNMGKPDSAYHVYTQLLEMKPTLKYLKDFLPIAYGLKKYEEIRAQLTKFIDKKPNDSELLWMKNEFAVTYYKEGNYEECLSVLNAVLDIDKKNAVALGYLDSLHHKKYKPALNRLISHFQKNFKGRDINDYWSLSVYLTDDHQFEEALKLLDKGLKALPLKEDQGYLYYLKSNVYFELTNQLFRSNAPNMKSTAQNAIEFANLAVERIPKFIAPLTIILVIYNDFLLDTQNSFEMAKKIKDIEPGKTLNRTNFVDAAFTAGKYYISLEECDALLREHAMGKIKLTQIEQLNLLFFAAATNCALNRTNDANIQFGKFYATYKNLPDDWSSNYLWNGVLKHLRENSDVFGKYSNTLVSLVNAITTTDRAQGLNIIHQSEDNLRSINNGKP